MSPPRDASRKDPGQDRRNDIRPDRRPDRRIDSHPILPPLPEADLEFTFDGRLLRARTGEVISSALYAAGISVFGHHHKDGGAQGVLRGPELTCSRWRLSSSAATIGSARQAWSNDTWSGTR